MKRQLIIILTIVIISGLAIYINKRHIAKFYLDDIYYDGNTFIDIKASDVIDLKKEKNSYIMFVYNNFCNFEIPCDEIFIESMEKNNLSFYAISYDEFKKTYLRKKVKYAPSILIVKKGRVVAYLDANKEEDIAKYQIVTAFDNWLEKYIYLSKKAH